MVDARRPSPHARDVTNVIPYARQSITQDDIDAVVNVLRSPFITQGPEIERFESAVCSVTGGRYAVAVNSGTAALHIACLAADIGPGDLVWTTPNSFAASANCAIYCGAQVDFVDIDPSTYNIAPSILAAKLRSAAKAGRLPKALIAVHFGGTPCDLAQLSTLTREYGTLLIEDAAHAVGATYHGVPIGASQYSDLTVFSFHPVKIVTTGEGGMVVTHRADLYQRLKLLRSHGITRDDAQLTAASEGPWYYEQLELGFNYRMTDIAATLGSRQLERLPDFLTRREMLAQQYQDALCDAEIGLPAVPGDRTSAWHLYVIQVDPARRRSLVEALHRAGILVNVHYIPIHLHPYYRRLGFTFGDFPHAEAYYGRAISLPMFFELTDSDQARVIEVLKAALDYAY